MTKLHKLTESKKEFNPTCEFRNTETGLYKISHFEPACFQVDVSKMEVTVASGHTEVDRLSLQIVTKFLKKSLTSIPNNL